MRFLLVFLTIILSISCFNPDIREDFYVNAVIPQSAEFEGSLKVEIHFSMPLNPGRFIADDIQLIDPNCPDCPSVSISSYSINEKGDILTIESDNVEPAKYYRIYFKGSITSQNNLLLSYHYNGDYIAEGVYYVKERRRQTPCITINEVLSYPKDSLEDEFIEIFNCSVEDVDLRGFYIKIDDFKPQKLLFTNKAYLIRPSEYAVILSDIQISVTQPVIYVQGRFGKNGISNTDLKRIQLLNESGIVISEFTPFARARRGISFERINPYEKHNLKNWGFSKAREGSTPMSVNSIYLLDIFPPEIISYQFLETDTNMNIIFKFSEEVYCESGNCIYLLSESNEKIHGVINTSINELRFTPVRPISYEGKYRVVATSSLRDKEGNNYSEGEILKEIDTPSAPPLKLYYPRDYTISSHTKYIEFISRMYRLDESEVYLKGDVQQLNLSCTRAKPEYHYLCAIQDDPDGSEKLCLTINGSTTDLCLSMYLSDTFSVPEIDINLQAEIKGMFYLSAESNQPCILFVDFSYKEDLDETFSFSTYSFSQRFDYIIKVQDAHKEYFVDIYCINELNQSSEKRRGSTTSYIDKGDSLIITEVLPNPDGTDTISEFIEILNNGNNIIDLRLVSIGDCIDPPINISRYSQPNLNPGSIAIVVSNKSKYFGGEMGCATISAADKMIGRDIRNSSPELLCLYYKGQLMDIFNPGIMVPKEDLSIERDDRTVYFDPSNWKISDIAGGTPCN